MENGEHQAIPQSDENRQQTHSYWWDVGSCPFGADSQTEMPAPPSHHWPGVPARALGNGEEEVTGTGNEGTVVLFTERVILCVVTYRDAIG